MQRRIANEKLQAIRALLGARGWSMRDLAVQSGVSPAALRLVIYGDQPTARRTYKIEKALNAPIWSDQHHFENLGRVSVFLETDFVLTKFHPLRAAAVAKGVRYTRAITHKDALLARVLEHLSEISTHTTHEPPSQTRHLRRQQS